MSDQQPPHPPRRRRGGARAEQRSEIVSRRLAQLSAELNGTAPDLADPHEDLDRDVDDDRDRHIDSEVVGPPRAGRHASPRAVPRPVGDLAQDRLLDASRDDRGLRTGWLPETLRGRVAFGPSQLAVVSVVVALGLLLTVWWTVRSRSSGELVGSAVVPALTTPAGAGAPSPSSGTTPPAASGAISGAASGAAPGSTSGASGSVVVDVSGQVRRPGIVVLPAGSRVVDALREAGGARPRVDLTALNQARVLVDGEQILVGQQAVGGVAATAAGAPSSSGAGPATLVDLNSADQATLEELPGVGPVTAQAILTWRTQHGAFASVDDLLEVDGIGEKTLADLAPYVTL